MAQCVERNVEQKFEAADNYSKEYVIAIRGLTVGDAAYFEVPFQTRCDNRGDVPRWRLFPIYSLLSAFNLRAVWSTRLVLLGGPYPINGWRPEAKVRRLRHRHCIREIERTIGLTAG